MLNQTKHAVAARTLVATVPQAPHGLFRQRPKGTSCNLVSAGRFHFCRFVRGSNRFSTTWPTIENATERCGYVACATRVQGAFQRCVQSVSGPSLLRAQTDREVETGATVKPSRTAPNRDQEGKRRSEICLVEMKMKGIAMWCMIGWHTWGPWSPHYAIFTTREWTSMRTRCTTIQYKVRTCANCTKTQERLLKEETA